MATFSVIVSDDRDSNSTHAACVLVEARNCSDSCFCFRCLKVGAEHSQLSAHGWSRSSERKEQVFGFHGLSDAPNTHFVHSVADFNNLHRDTVHGRRGVHAPRGGAFYFLCCEYTQ